MIKRGTIILGGGGDIEVSKDLDKEYFKLLNTGSKILYIPIAIIKSSRTTESCFDWFSSVISQNAPDKELTFTMLLDSVDIDFEEFDSIYIGGGNTYKLLDYVYTNKLDLKLKKHIENGGIVFGGSAGAIILGKDIRTVFEENNKNYSNFKGLNILDDLSVVCHYDDSELDKVKKLSSIIGGKIITLRENSGLIINNGKTRKVNDVFLFDQNGKKDFI